MKNEYEANLERSDDLYVYVVRKVGNKFKPIALAVVLKEMVESDASVASCPVHLHQSIEIWLKEETRISLRND